MRRRARCAHRTARDIPGRPGPLKIEASNPSVDIEHLADEVETGTDSRCQRRRIDLVERDAAGRGFCIVVATGRCNGERPFDERASEGSSLRACKMRQLTPR